MLAASRSNNPHRRRALPATEVGDDRLPAERRKAKTENRKAKSEKRKAKSEKRKAKSKQNQTQER